VAFKICSQQIIGHSRHKSFQASSCIAIGKKNSHTKKQKRQVCGQPPTSAVNVMLPHLLISTITCYQLWDNPQQIRSMLLLLSTDGTNKQTDGRTESQLFHKPCSTHYAGSVNEHKQAIPTTKVTPYTTTKQINT